jgi:acetoin utilization deacetylase AcuC-like enzyme
VVEPAPATREELLRVHTAEYLDDLDHLRWTPQHAVVGAAAHQRDRAGLSARRRRDAAGARRALECGTAINLGGGFHHAFPARAEGFLLHQRSRGRDPRAASRGRHSRAAVVDADVHQGNGTAAVFRDDAQVFTFSIHQEQNYPVPKEVSDLDVGLANGTGDEEYNTRLREALERVWAFEPELVLYQAGADPYREDVLGGLALSQAGLEERDRLVLEGAASAASSVVTLGGGYARRVEDTVAIHFQTCRVALRQTPRERSVRT